MPRHYCFMLCLPPHAELHARRGSGTIEINSRVYERARKPRPLECRAKIGGDLCPLATRGNRFKIHIPRDHLSDLSNVARWIVIRPLSRNNARAESRKGSVLAAMTRSPLSLRRGSRAGVDVSPRLLTRREFLAPRLSSSVARRLIKGRNQVLTFSIVVRISHDEK